MCPPRCRPPREGCRLPSPQQVQLLWTQPWGTVQLVPTPGPQPPTGFPHHIPPACAERWLQTPFAEAEAACLDAPMSPERTPGVWANLPRAQEACCSRGEERAPRDNLPGPLCPQSLKHRTLHRCGLSQPRPQERGAAVTTPATTKTSAEGMAGSGNLCLPDTNPQPPPHKTENQFHLDTPQQPYTVPCGEQLLCTVRTQAGTPSLRDSLTDLRHGGASWAAMNMSALTGAGQ